MTASPLPRQLVTTLLLASIPFSAHLPGFAWQPIRAPETASDALLLADKKNKNREDRPRQSTGSGGGNQLPRLFSPQRQQQPNGQGGGGMDFWKRQRKSSPGSSTDQPSRSRRSYPLSAPYKKGKTGGFATGEGGSGQQPAKRKNHSSKTNIYIKNKNLVNVRNRVDSTVIRRGSWSYRRGWTAARPWRYGWYSGWSPGVVVYPGWGWWADAAPGWGVTSLSSTLVIQQYVDGAVNSDEETSPIPNSKFRIHHGSITPIAPDVIEFNFELDGESYTAKADCKNGYLNDEKPAALDESELMHAACTIAFSSFETT